MPQGKKESARLGSILRHTSAYFDQLSPALAIRANTIDDLGQVDSSGQMILR